MRYIMEDAGMRVLVTESVYVGVLSGLGVENVEVLLCVDDDYSMYDDMDLEREVCPSNVGYLIYTSGTTGQPKGVVCHHHGAVQIIRHSIMWNETHGLPCIDSIALCLNIQDKNVNNGGIC